MTVIIAFLANVLVAIAKTVAALVTGSASMVAEAAHSWADSANEVFLIVANRRSSQPKDVRHPLGYGREAFVWSLFAAVGIFTIGAVVSIMRGVQELSSPGPVDSPEVAYVVLAIAFVLEGGSFTQAVVQARRRARARGVPTITLILTGSDSTLRAVVAEDFAALIGLAIAVAGIAAHQVTGSSLFDAIGSILIGVLLAVVAIVLIDRNRRLLVGANSTPALRNSIGRALLARPEVERVTSLHLEYIGPDRLFLVAEVDLAGNAAESDIALRLRTIERAMEQHELIETAVLGLSVFDEPSLQF